MGLQANKPAAISEIVVVTNTTTTTTVTTTPVTFTVPSLDDIDPLNVPDANEAIVGTTCPANSFANKDGKCECNTGFKPDPQNNKLCVSGSFAANMSFGLVLAMILNKLL